MRAIITLPISNTPPNYTRCNNVLVRSFSNDKFILVLIKSKFKERNKFRKDTFPLWKISDPVSAGYSTKTYKMVSCGNIAKIQPPKPSIYLQSNIPSSIDRLKQYHSLSCHLTFNHRSLTK